MNLIAMAIPFFFLLIAVEYVASRIRKKKIYRFNDSINDLSLGILDQTSGIFMSVIFFLNYTLVWDQYRLFDMGASSRFDVAGFPIWIWIACFLAKDMTYYWAHRMSHEMNIGWATHIAHHQSEEYNLTVALRQGAFQSLFFNVFYLPLAFVGFPPAVYGICSALNTIYQFWIHTRLIGKLGPLEWVLNTPSHHRVHHGRDEKYIDRNHGGTLIIWDRLFGTFQVEEEEPDYGIVRPLKSWNPLWGQVHYFVKLCKTAWNAPRWADKVRLWVREPAWTPEGMAPPPGLIPESRQPGYRDYDARAPRGLNAYIAFHFIVGTLLATGFIEVVGGMSWPERTLAFVAIAGTLTSIGAMFETRRWGFPLEFLRLALLGGLLITYGGDFFGYPAYDGWIADTVTIGGMAVSFAWFARFRPAYLRAAALTNAAVLSEPLDAEEESARA
jgi:sterol desaturase/sphingolipid hydroxylase (fatty acid hydroxylase superfamily)